MPARSTRDELRLCLLLHETIDKTRRFPPDDHQLFVSQRRQRASCARTRIPCRAAHHSCHRLLCESLAPSFAAVCSSSCQRQNDKCMRNPNRTASICRRRIDNGFWKTCCGCKPNCTLDTPKPTAAPSKRPTCAGARYFDSRTASCRVCPPGTRSNRGRDGCEACPPGTAWGKVAACESCGPGQQPTVKRDGCEPQDASLRGSSLGHEAAAGSNDTWFVWLGACRSCCDTENACMHRPVHKRVCKWARCHNIIIVRAKLKCCQRVHRAAAPWHHSLTALAWRSRTGLRRHRRGRGADVRSVREQFRVGLLPASCACALPSCALPSCACALPSIPRTIARAGAACCPSFASGGG